MATSQLDPKVNLTHTQWAVTLFTAAGGGFVGMLQNRHTYILVEGVKLNDTVFSTLYHLDANDAKLEYIVGRAYANVISLSFEEFKKNKKVADRTPVFLLSKENVEVMLAEIARDKKKKVPFDLIGRDGAIIPNIIYKPLGEPHHNCFTWAAEKLFFAGIKLPVMDERLTLANDSLPQVRKNVPYKSREDFGPTELAFFAKRGRDDAIRALFTPGKVNVNTLVKIPEGGPIESFLGQYTPLALAIAYNHFSTVKLLIEDYQADIHVKSGRLRDHDAYACAMKKWGRGGMFPIFRSLFGDGQRPSEQIRKYIETRCRQFAKPTHATTPIKAKL